MSNTRQRTSGLWVCTTYFNPLQYRSRRTNYQIFRDQLAAPLLTVELSFDDSFELKSADADHLLQLRGRDVMFQKERLLNLALAALPDDCSAVAWIDCDVVLGAADWPRRILMQLDEYPVLQLYEEQYMVPAGRRWDETGRRPEHLFGRSVASRLARREMTMRHFRQVAGPTDATAWGCAWAAQRSLLDRHKFYDACILGSGDVAFACGAVGGFGRMKEALRMSDAWYRHYLDWAGPLYDDVRGRVGCLPEPLFHLWHGDLKRRKYRRRHQEFSRFGFDPAIDLRIGEQGCWAWNSPKPEMHAYVAEYFRSRREDVR